jgi:hypothetical protein
MRRALTIGHLDLARALAELHTPSSAARVPLVVFGHLPERVAAQSQGDGGDEDDRGGGGGAAGGGLERAMVAVVGAEAAPRAERTVCVNAAVVPRWRRRGGGGAGEAAVTERHFTLIDLDLVEHRAEERPEGDRGAKHDDGREWAVVEVRQVWVTPTGEVTAERSLEIRGGQVDPSSAGAVFNSALGGAVVREVAWGAWEELPAAGRRAG